MCDFKSCVCLRVKCYYRRVRFNCKVFKTTSKFTMMYLIKIWFSTCIISPLTIILFNSKFQTSIVDILLNLGFCILCGLLLSLPTFIILFFVYRKIITRNIKIILSIASVALVFITFYLTGFYNLQNYRSELFFPFVYSIVMIFSIWVFKYQNNFS